MRRTFRAIRWPLLAALLAAPLNSAAVAATLASPTTAATAADTLSFEVRDPESGFAGWRTPPNSAVSADSTIVHGGRYAARIRRDASSPDEFTPIARIIPGSVTGDTLTLSGWLRTEGVSGFACLWLREDGISGMLQFDNMAGGRPSGTSPWTAYRISLPLDRRAKSIAFGALLAGQGTAHVDDLELRVDGVPIADVPPAKRPPTGIETDHEFDAGSGVGVTTLSASQTRNVALLVQVWGFVKYHDPRVTAGKLHWDYELFRALPAVLGARTEAAARGAVLRWLDRLGEPPACDPCAAPPDSSHLAAPVEWIHDRKALGRELSARLERIYDRRDASGESYYASFAAGWKPDFSGEAAFDAPALPDPGYRLLAVARFWNIVQYWFPYRDLIPGSWHAVLAEFLPRAVAASDVDAYRLAMTELFARVGDGHATVWGNWDVRPPRGPCEVAVSLRPVEGRLVVGGYRDATLGPGSGLRPGDVLLAIDGSPVDALVEANARYYSGSNETWRRRLIAHSLTRGPCGPCRLGVERDGRTLEIASRRDSIGAMALLAGWTHDLPGEGFRLLAPDAAYLKASAVRQSECASYVTRAAGTRCFVVDLRGYPSEYVPYALGGHFVAGPTPFARFTSADPANPGAFLRHPPVTLQPLEPRYAGTLVILVDDATMSRGEFTAMALRAAPGAIVVGSTTGGADGDIARIGLPGGIGTAISSLGVYYPDDRPTQRVGLVPDVEARATVDGIRRGRDVVLEAALRKVLGREVEVGVRP